jgi:hypothetical protein
VSLRAVCRKIPSSVTSRVLSSNCLFTRFQIRFGVTGTSAKKISRMTRPKVSAQPKRLCWRSPVPKQLHLQRPSRCPRLEGTSSANGGGPAGKRLERPRPESAGARSSGYGSLASHLPWDRTSSASLFRNDTDAATVVRATWGLCSSILAVPKPPAPDRRT